MSYIHNVSDFNDVARTGDYDGDGKTEVYLSEADFEKTFGEDADNFDANNDGYVTNDEFSSVMRARKNEAGSSGTGGTSESGKNSDNSAQPTDSEESGKNNSYAKPQDVSFNAIDTGADGKVSAEEWAAAGLDPAEFDAIAGDDGVIDLNEYISNQGKGVNYSKPTEVSFGSIRGSEDGISADEWKAAGFDPAKFSEYDSNGDGSIDKNEYASVKNNDKNAQHASPRDVAFSSANTDTSGENKGIDANEWNVAGLDPDKFSEYDADGDGFVSEQEYKQGIVEDNKAKGAQYVKPSDTDFASVAGDDGVITEEEWNLAGLDPDKFAEYDKDGNGVSADEYKQGVINDNKAKSAEHVNPKDINFSRVDADGDGTITEDEWNLAGLDPDKFSKYDKDGNGISKEEYATVRADENKVKGAQHTKPEDTDFSSVDLNGDGSISEDEWNAAGLDDELYSKYAGEKGGMTEDEWNDVTADSKMDFSFSLDNYLGLLPYNLSFSDIDADGNGDITENEWTKAGYSKELFAKYAKTVQSTGEDGKTVTRVYMDSSGFKEMMTARRAMVTQSDFARLDLDGNGIITKSEAGSEYSKISKADSSGDKNITLDEWNAYIANK